MKKEEQKEELYDLNDKNKESVEKKTNSLLRHIKSSQQPNTITDLRGQRYTPFSHESHESQPFDIKHDLENQRLPSLSQNVQFVDCNKYYIDVPDFYKDRTK